MVMMGTHPRNMVYNRKGRRGLIYTGFAIKRSAPILTSRGVFDAAVAFVRQV